jgi:pyruvate,water dikinase
MWLNPEDRQLLWHTDRMHFPEQVPPLMDLQFHTFNEGFRRAADAYDMPVSVRYHRLNTYLHMATAPTVPHEQMDEKGKRSEEKLKAGVAQFSHRWNAEWFPEVQRYLSHWETYDLRSATMPALLEHFDVSASRLARLWEIHFLLAMSLFDELYRDVFGSSSALAAVRLLEGFGNKTVESGHALWQLSRKALVSPPVLRAVEAGSVGDVLNALERTPEGQAFLAELRGFLNEFGRRTDTFCDLSKPSWIEDPTTALRNLRGYVKQPDRDLKGELVALGAERDRLIAEARQRIKVYPRQVVEQFEFLMKAAQAATVLQEDHNYWIDQRSMDAVRKVLLEIGRRLAEASAVDAQDDVFYLTPEELRETVARLKGANRHELVRQRKAEMERFRTVQPPMMLGAMPAGEPPDNPMARAMGKFFGAPPPPSKDRNVINGNPGSPGKVRGKAAVLLTLGDAGKLQRGDVLVAPATMPAWTPLFATAGAVVTDVGGVLSHCAIVAREYHIPAVVGTGMATAVIKDGQTLEVDGDAGTVRIL